MVMQFEYPRNALLDLSPINDAIDFRAKQQQRAKDNAYRDEQLGMQRDEYKAKARERAVRNAAGIAQMALDEKDLNKGAAVMQRLIAQDPQRWGAALKENNIDPADWQTFARTLVAEARGPLDPLDQKLKQGQIANQGLHAQQIQAQLAQLKSQTPQARAKLAQQYGMQPGTDEFNMFVINGQYAPKSDTVTLKEGETILQKRKGPDGQMSMVPVAAGAPKPMQEYQTKDAMWAERLNRSNQNIDQVAGVGPDGKPRVTKGPDGKDVTAYDPTRWQNRFFPDDASWSNLGIANLANSKQWQQYQQAAREGIAAILRKDTGAAVTQQEWDLYFPMLYPQPGDSPEVVKQKNATREQTARALRASSGGAYERMFPQNGSQQGGTADPLGIR